MVSMSVPALPFPVFQVSRMVKRYLLYDVDTITWLRKVHNILGVLIGTLPQIPQQNVFLGLPLELQPEEARLLVEKGIAYVVDDLQWHKDTVQSTTSKERQAYIASLDKEGMNAAKAVEQQKLQRTEDVIKKLQLANKRITSDTSSSTTFPPPEVDGSNESLFGQASRGDSLSRTSTSSTIPWIITPTTSYPPLPTPFSHATLKLPTVNSASYALFKHLHGLSYFLSPGLRFGCQFLVYPGDPLRFHSHFLAMSTEWDEEIDLLDLIGGGRLGTGVKKGWLIGGVERTKIQNGQDGTVKARSGSDTDLNPSETAESRVRTFCIEWGGM